MGGSSTKYNRSGGIGIQLQNSSYFDGDDVSGFIHINVAIPIAQSTVYIIFKGKEVTRWEETKTITENVNGKSETRTIVEHFHGKNRICNFNFPIYKFEYGLAPGGYSLPFTFRLPPNIPGTFYYADGTTKAIIEYKFHVKLLSATNDNLKGKLPMSIRQRVINYETNVALNKVARMSTWCCIDKGTCKIDVIHSQDTYNPTQVANLSVAVDNTDSKLRVRTITNHLYYSLRIKDKHGRNKFIKNNLISLNVPIGIAPGGVMNGTNAAQLRIDLPSRMNTLNNMYSTKGQLIDCMYTIETEADMDGSCMCCGEYPKVSAIMNIVPVGVIVPIMPQAPPGWNPQTLEAINLQYDPRYEATAPGLY
jgi:Arrestin (or S-antigen), N-terminal domain